MDLKTRQITTLPGLEGLYSPRWSPDGRYITALQAGPEILVIFDVRTKKWAELTKIAVGFSIWSRDSKYIYFDSAENPPNLNRVRITDKRLEQVASLLRIRLAPVYGGFLNGLAPEDSPLVVRDVGNQEIYARWMWSYDKDRGAVPLRPILALNDAMLRGPGQSRRFFGFAGSDEAHRECAGTKFLGVHFAAFQALREEVGHEGAFSPKGDSSDR